AETGFRGTVRDDRPARPLTARASAAGFAAPRGEQTTRAGIASVLPDRPPNLLRQRIPCRSRYHRRLPSAQCPRLRVPEERRLRPAAVQRQLRIGLLRGAAR